VSGAVFQKLNTSHANMPVASFAVLHPSCNYSLNVLISYSTLP